MRRFAAELWGEPVAVNDIGWVSYRNESYVLDLWGLGLEEARRKRIAADLSFAGELLRRENVALMMIYEGWLGTAVPADWVLVGRLALTRTRLSASEAEVSFYARPDRAEEVAALARLFASALPAGAEFRFAEQRGLSRPARRR
jgi:hypothetical protein